MQPHTGIIMLLSSSGARRARCEFFHLSGFRAGLARLAEMRRAVEGRRAIARMDARMLADIGLSQGEAMHEASRRPWDTVPRRF
jgi:uncharacterized protein YjiS (DUF1127 family)